MQNLLETVMMTAHCLGSTDEAWHVERQLQQNLDKCVKSNIKLIQRLNVQNLVIPSLYKQLEACECKRVAVGSKDLNNLLHLALHSCQISNSMLRFCGYITACNCKTSSAEGVTHKDKSIGWGRTRD